MDYVYLVMDAIDPRQHFLVGEAMEGPRQPIQASREGVVGVRKGAGHHMGGVRAHIATLHPGPAMPLRNWRHRDH